MANGDEKKEESTGTDPFFLALMELYCAHERVCRGEFAKLGLNTSQTKLLFLLLRKEGAVQKELAELCQITPPSFSSLIGTMENKGLVKREQCQLSGKHAMRVYLTDTGRKLACAVEEILWSIGRATLEGFTDEEKSEFMSYLFRASDNIKKL